MRRLILTVLLGAEGVSNGQPAAREVPAGTYTVSHGRRGPISEDGVSLASCGVEGDKALAAFTTVGIEYRRGFCRINGERWDDCRDTGQGVVATRDDHPNLRLSFGRSGPRSGVAGIVYRSKLNECGDGLVLEGTWIKAARD